jgi:hypothetical protein
VCDACGLTTTKPSKSLLEKNISFSTPLLQQNHASPNVESVHWLALKSQVVAKQLLMERFHHQNVYMLESQVMAFNHLHLPCNQMWLQKTKSKWAQKVLIERH